MEGYHMVNGLEFIVYHINIHHTPKYGKAYLCRVNICKPPRNITQLKSNEWHWQNEINVPFEVVKLFEWFND